MRDYKVFYRYIKIGEKENNEILYCNFRAKNIAEARKIMKNEIIKVNADSENDVYTFKENGNITLNRADGVYEIFGFELKELPLMHYRIIWDDDHNYDSDGDFETLDEAKSALEYSVCDAEVDASLMDGYENEIEWDEDRLGFLSIHWEGERDNPTDYWERTYRIHEIDEDGNIIDDG